MTATSVTAPAMTAHWWSQKRWGIGILLLLVTAVGSLDRQALSVTASTIKGECGLSNTQYGALGFAFLLSYAVGQLISGLLSIASAPSVR